MKYYLFIKDKHDIDKYHTEFDRVSQAIKDGVTPVYSEIRAAKTNMIETIPYNLLSGIFIILGTWILTKLGVSEIISVGITLVINNVFSVIANYIFTVIKHKLRLKLCKRMGIEPSEHNIAVMESLEYQSV